MIGCRSALVVEAMNRFWSGSVMVPLSGHSTRRRLMLLLALLGMLLAVITPRQHAEWVNPLMHEQYGQSSANDQEMAVNHHCDQHGVPQSGSGHFGCDCLHGLCSGLVALPGQQAASALPRAAHFSNVLHRAVSLPAHGHPPFRPPTVLNS